MKLHAYDGSSGPTETAMPEPIREQLVEEVQSWLDDPLLSADNIADALLPIVQAYADKQAARALETVDQLMAARYRDAWAAWTAHVQPGDNERGPSAESRIAWARVNQALDDKEAIARLTTLASRPSADAEALRETLRIHHPIMRSETGPFSGCRCGGVKLGQDVIAHVVEHLRARAAALDPTGDPR